MIAAWYLVISIIGVGVTSVPMETGQACSEAKRQIEAANKNDKAVCIRTK